MQGTSSGPMARSFMIYSDGATTAAAHEITRRAGMRADLCGIQLHQRQQHDRARLQSMLGRPRLLSVIGPNPIRAWQTQSLQPPSLLSYLLCGARPPRSARLPSCILLAYMAVGTRVEPGGQAVGVFMCIIRYFYACLGGADVRCLCRCKDFFFLNLY